jgi:phenylpropionate dioxygenase-like ring-hydroxylating dioxygenase large terminal subunit
MISKQWYVILESKEIRPHRVIGFKRFGQNLIAWRDQAGTAYVLGDRCPHLGASLSQAAFCGNRIECAFHGIQFNGQGIAEFVPALGKSGKIPRALHALAYPTYEQAGLVWVWYDSAGGNPSGTPQFFEALSDDFSYISFQQPWNIHYSRMAENQLDMMHLPFVHATTIGRSGKTIVDGPYIEVEGNGINVWVSNRHDDGQAARRASEFVKPETHPGLQFLFPNLWHNWISEDVRVMAAFVPVDEEHSIFYGRFYQRMNTLPILKDLINLSGKIGSQIIARQDRRVVTRILPPASSLEDGDILLQGDHAIVTYRRMRKALLSEQEGN